MPKNYKPEKRAGGILEGVAYADGKGGYIPFANKPAPNYGARGKAAAKMIRKKGGY